MAAHERALSEPPDPAGDADEDDHASGGDGVDGEQRYKENVAERRYAYTDQLKDKTAANFYVVVVCRDDAHCRHVLEAIGVADVSNRYVGGDRVLAAIEATAVDGIA